MPRSRRGRLALLFVLACLAIVPIFLALTSRQVSPPGPSLAAANVQRPSAATTPLVVPGTSIDPASGLRLIDGPISFTPAATAPAVAPPKINATSGIVVDIDSDTILWERNDHEALPPASTTKVMTSLVVLDNFSPETLITATPSALTQASDESKMGIKPGEKLTVQELMEGMLLVSANDAATTLAVDTVGMPRFLEAMNAQEKALGLQDSTFKTPVGLDTPGHLISAYDLAAIATVDVDNFPLFRQIVASPEIDLPASADHHAFWLYNINELIGTYPGAVGIKPGYTGNAGYCFVAEAVRNGHHIITVLMNAPYVYSQSAKLLTWAFNEESTSPSRSTPVATSIPSPIAATPTAPLSNASATDSSPTSPPAASLPGVPQSLLPKNN